MLAEGLRTHSVYNYTGCILSYIKIVYKPRNIPVHVKDGCLLLIKTVVFIEQKNASMLRKFCSIVCAILGKRSRICIGWAQSLHCAVMQHMRAVWHHHVRPTLTNAHYPPGKPVNRARCWLSCRPCYKNGGFLANGTNHLRRMSYHLSWLSVTVRILVQVRCDFPTLKFHNIP